jgi:hypothetical protein
MDSMKNNGSNVRNTYFARNPTESERLARVQYGRLLAIQYAQEQAARALAPKLRMAQDAIEQEIARLEDLS